MPIINRDLDTSQQKECYVANLDRTPSGISAGILNPGLATAQTFVVCNVPFPATLVSIEESVYGLSGTPTHSFWIYRFAGGFTSIQVGASFNVTAFGTSGSLAHSLYAAATFPLLAGDQIALYCLGTNAAVASAQVSVVVKALQDYKTYWGS